KRLNKKIEITGVFITQYDKRKILHRDVMDTINTYFQDKVFKTKIRDNIALAEAPSQGTDILDTIPKVMALMITWTYAKRL
ncbi:MAG: ParA family protein, partial [Chloroflexia bacterium]|nr:ParA family protein [Chloroflexia bacterium]